MLLAFGWFVNSINVPAYFANLGTGQLGWNTASHVVIGALNVLLGLTLGWLYRDWGVVAGWAISLAAGSMLVLMGYCHSHAIKVRELLPDGYLGLLLASLAAAIAGPLVYVATENHLPFWSVTLAVLFGCTVLVGAPAWLHPMRKRLTTWALSALRQAQQGRRHVKGSPTVGC